MISADYKDESKEKLFNELRIFLTSGAEPLPAYTELAGRLGIAESTLRSHVTCLRARYREVLRAEVRQTGARAGITRNEHVYGSDTLLRGPVR
jgi:hypothetical protein